MSKVIDRTGQRYGRLVVTERAENDRYGNAMWRAVCDCGRPAEVLAYNLTSGNTTSCSCFQRERILEANTTHGQCGSPAYVSWQSAVKRTTDRNCESYRRYGGAGVVMCERFRSSVENLVEDIGERPEGKTLDRISSYGHYSCGACQECVANDWPANVQWATHQEQQRNKRNNRLVTHDGETQCVATWAEITGLPYNTLRKRLDNNWPVHIALTAPINSRLAQFAQDDAFEAGYDAALLDAEPYPTPSRN